MKKFLITRGVRALCAAMIFVMILFIAAPAAGYAKDSQVKFTVKQEFTGDSASAESKFFYKLKPLATGHPMPPGSDPDGFLFTISGTDSVQLGPLNYIEEDIYRYEVFQVIEKEKPGYKHDKRVYTIEVYADSSFGAEIIVLNQNGIKVNEIEFVNSHEVLPKDPNPNPDPPVNKIVYGNTGKTGGYKTGDEFNLGLYFVLFVFGGMLFSGAIAYLLICRKRKGNAK